MIEEKGEIMNERRPFHNFHENESKKTFSI
jgi:hypothetical protein